ncbi:hypothetical protein [Streptomyces sp. TRM64462]|nr:hypothetical protein [Streptomyces sp. TRM64462]
MVPVLFEADPGHTAWDLVASHPGTAHITATSRRTPSGFRLTVLVPGR